MMMELLVMIALLIAFSLIAGRARRKRPGEAISGWHQGQGGYTVRLAGLDAAEWNQPAKHRFGFWFNHGKRVKVAVEGLDRSGRVLATVSCRGRDVGERPVRSGPAISRFGNRCQAAGQAAKNEHRGMRGYDQATDPRAWRPKSVRAIVSVLVDAAAADLRAEVSDGAASWMAQAAAGSEAQAGARPCGGMG